MIGYKGVFLGIIDRESYGLGEEKEIDISSLFNGDLNYMAFLVA